MSKKIPCEMIQDLFPSYIEELTSDVSNQLIEEHMEDCPDCRQVLKRMQDPAVETEDDGNQKEIDFLKKEKRKRKYLMIGSFLGALLLAGLIFFARMYLIGAEIAGEYISAEIEITGNEISVNAATLDSDMRITDIIYEETDGISNIRFKGVHQLPVSFLKSDTEFRKTFVSEDEIREVVMGKTIVWADGYRISPITSAVYRSAHPYIGNMSDNGDTVRALNMTGYLGSFRNELQTKEEPFSWTMCLDHSFSFNRKEHLEKKMHAYACAILAVIDNLGELTFEYAIDGTPCSLTVTAAEAGEYAGEDIKSVGKDVSKLQLLMEKSGLTEQASVLAYSDEAEDTLWMDVINRTEKTWKTAGITFLLDGNEIGFQEVCNADESGITEGTVIPFLMIPEDFSEDLQGTGKEIRCRISFTDTDGIRHEAEEELALPAEFGVKYRIELKGSAESGYEAEFQ
ncbi:MAG: DUF4825 domain-containing protein [Lachnospiraceae bacterium]